MIKFQLQRYFALLTPLLILSQTHNLQAQNTTQSTTPVPTTPPLTVPCEALKNQTTGVHQWLNEYRHLVGRRKCIVLSTNPSENLSKLIKQIPEDTVILFSSETTSAATLSPSVTPASGKIPIVYLIDNEITLKDGQHIIGAPDEGFEIILTPNIRYTDTYMITFGSHNYFNFEQTQDSHIRHITFQPTTPNGRMPIRNIISTHCSNRRLIVENNVFNLVCLNGVNIDCRLSLDASANDLRQGPALMFVNNTVTGDIITVTGHVIKSRNVDYIPDGGVAVTLPYIKSQSHRIAINGNTFRGKMAWVAELDPGPGSSIDIFRNTIDIDNINATLFEVLGQPEKEKYALTIVGHTSTSEEPSLCNLAGNQIRVTSSAAIDIKGIVKLALACNHFQAVKLWRQEQHEYSIRAADPLSLADECERSVQANTTTVGSPTLCQIVNTWTPINNSTATALSGLTNLEGQFYFNSSVCLTVDSPSVSSPSPSPSATSANKTFILSAGTKATTTVLGIITALNLLLSL
ncbi:hypothetical protein [Endozoicomonas sp. 4G]|uniref:hypothetical protein n=1 Tax=Endozoicomonas sp. 4G TaxID=2872754 RepID=UPI002078DBBB|nr:hypothetical protein [Endozoicomonas sp. 4G]